MYCTIRSSLSRYVRKYTNTYSRHLFRARGLQPLLPITLTFEFEPITAPECSFQTHINPAIYRTSSAPPMFRLDDPWFWGVERVVATLCNPSGPFLTRFLREIDPITIPDLIHLERELRKHKISGLVMLTELTQPFLRDEFGIAAMGQRTVIIHMIMDLRRQSDKYVEYLKENKIMCGTGRRSKSISSSIALPSRTQFDLFAFTENSSASLVPLVRAPPPASGLSNENFSFSPAHSVQASSKSPKTLNNKDGNLPRPQDEAMPSTEHEIHLTDARIDAAVDESPTMQGKWNYRSYATKDCTHLNATTDDTRTDTRAEDMFLPRDSGRKNETYIIDENGKKRRRLVLIPAVAAVAASLTSRDSPTLQSSAEQPSPQIITVADQLRDPTPSDVASSITLKELPDCLPRSSKRNIIRNSRQMYLGIESLPVDELFYGKTEIGEEVSHDVDYGEIWQAKSRESSDNFSFFGNHFGAGQRCYVYGRLKHYLYARNSRRVKRQGQCVIVVVPYPDYFMKKHHQRSVTIYSKSSGKVIASRMDQSLWTGNDGVSSENHISGQKSANLPNAPCPEETDPTNWDYLKKWDFQVGQDKVLPVFGDSSSENEADLETWRKIEQEEQSVRRRGLNQSKNKKRKLTTESVEQAINDATEQILTHWTIVEKPKLLSKAWKLWSDARRKNMVPEQIHLWSSKIQDLETRLSNLRKEILKEEWGSAQEVVKQCKSMEQSIFDREGYNWRILTIRLKTAPEKPPPRLKTGRGATLDSNQPQEESSKTVDSGDLSDYESSINDIADFIDDEDIHDEILDPIDEDDDGMLGDSEARESIDRYVSDSYDEADEKSEDTSDEDVSDEDVSVKPPARRQSIVKVKKTIASPARAQLSENPGIIDLTIESELSEGEAALRNSLEKSSPLSPSLCRSSLGNDSEDTFFRVRTRKPLFKVSPGSSAIICLDNDSSDDTRTGEDPGDSNEIALPSPPSEKKPKRRELPESSGDTPRKKRKFAVPESQQAIGLRLEAQERFQRILKRRFQEMDFNNDGSSKVAINTGKLDDQEFIYINPKIAGRMQPHQLDGVQFMWREVIAERQGCLVAQTMGLGKTMQVVTLLVTVAEAVRSSSDKIRNQVPEDFHESRALIICPPALIENWWEEFLMWTPGKFENGEFKENIGSLRKVNSTMSIEGRLSEIEGWKDGGGVLLIGFHTFRDLIANKPNSKHGNRALDVEKHQMVQDTLLNRPNIIVADEAHHFKSTHAEINQIINRLKSKSRIALTGSPLSNNLMEYHSLVDWVAPNFMGTRVEFQANYVERIQDGLYQDSTMAEYRASLKWLEVLKNELRPKVHRADITALRERLKGKQEFVIRVNLTPLQEEIYRVYVEARLAATAKDEVHNSRIWVWLYALGLVCSHPVCFKNKLLEQQKVLDAERKNKKHKEKKHADGEIEEVDTSVCEIETSPGVAQRQLALFQSLTEPHDSISFSNKMLILMDIVNLAAEAGDKVLVFSHHLDTLDYAGKQMAEAGVNYSRIDGKVLPTDRQKVTKDFNSGNIQVCLISTRAGGQGLNLHSANRVVILDEHFNPMHEEQAVGRAYRIGQKKSVFVYYLIAAGTFEELVQNQSVFKQQLARRVVDNRNPARRAMKKMGDYLFYPKVTEQKDLQLFSRKDTEVLDRILEKYSKYVSPVLSVHQKLTC